MTRPKFRPCTFCQTPNQASRRTCYVCFGSLSSKKKLKEKAESLDSQWAEVVLKNRNVCRIIDSARIAVQKLESIGYKPILFIGKKDTNSHKWVADVITHLDPTSTTRNFLEKMQRAYEFILSKGTSTPVHPNTPTEQQLVQSKNATKEHCADKQTHIKEHAEIPSEEQAETLINKQAESLAKEQPEMTTQEHQSSRLLEEHPKSLSDEQTETVFVLNLVPLSPSSVPCSQSFQKKKRDRSTSQTTSPTSPPPFKPADQPSLQSLHPPASHAISQSLSEGGQHENKKRKSCRRCSRQKVFQFEEVTESRINEGNTEVKVRWLPCSVCGKIWDDTWEPASEFQHHFAMPDVPPPSATEEVFL
ncbi:uncharacterized protein LOC143415020 [Maylandia zebra]|uniref:Chromo domain-containing protein n=2 Tax=Astatotilapia calliptera TaxID=8154 RepID=A0AAX7U2B1_ASTCA|nr:uncharacterized protein LOC113031234 [Astatotilapia calliptera]